MEDEAIVMGRNSRPLRIAVLVKQVPIAESMTLGNDGRLVRDQTPLEMNPYCRRAVAKGVEIATETAGSCTVLTMGPSSAAEVLREAVAWGADSGVHLCDEAFAGSDTLATARALVAALAQLGPFDLVLAGKNSVDGETGQVGPEIAELAGLAFVSGVRQLDVYGEMLSATLELDDGQAEVELKLPAVVTVAERLCEPCKVPPGGRVEVTDDRITCLVSSDLGAGPWGEAGSPTKVGSVRLLESKRGGQQMSGPLPEQVAEAVRVIAERGALSHVGVGDTTASPRPTATEFEGRSRWADSVVTAPVVAVLLEDGRASINIELISAAQQISLDLGGRVAGIGVSVDQVSFGGADEWHIVQGGDAAEDIAAGLIDWCRLRSPWSVLAPSTAFGREVAGRTAAALGVGLVGDAIELRVVDGELIAGKPALSGALVADISCESTIRMATIRPGVLPVRRLISGEGGARVTVAQVQPRGRVRLISSRHDDAIESLARADVVMGVGAGVLPDDYQRLSALASVLGAELAATRKVTDKGWAPRSRQIGITGRHIDPRLYVAIGISGKFNHIVGVRGAGTVLAINCDPSAPIFGHADVGIVGDWKEAVPLLQEAISRVLHLA